MGKLVSNVVGSILEPFTGAKATQQAAAQAAQAQQQAALTSANVAAFRPVGISSRFGTSNFGYQDIGGVPRLSSATYTPAQDIAAIRDALLSQAGTSGIGLAQAASPVSLGLFSLGNQYLAETPAQARQQFINEQMAILDPIRAREEQRLASSVFGRGRAGLNVGDIGQPELATLANARRQQDLQLAAQAEQAAQQRIGFGTGLFSQGLGIQTEALAPLQSLLGTASSVEEIGQQPYQLGLQAGGLSQGGAQAGAGLLGAGLAQAAQTRYQGVQQANMANQAFLQSLMSSASGGFGGGGGMGGFYSPYEQRAGANFLRPGTYG